MSTIQNTKSISDGRDFQTSLETKSSAADQLKSDGNSTGAKNDSLLLDTLQISKTLLNLALKDKEQVGAKVSDNPLQKNNVDGDRKVILDKWCKVNLAAVKKTKNYLGGVLLGQALEGKSSLGALTDKEAETLIDKSISYWLGSGIRKKEILKQFETGIRDLGNTILNDPHIRSMVADTYINHKVRKFLKQKVNSVHLSMTELVDVAMNLDSSRELFLMYNTESLLQQSFEFPDEDNEVAQRQLSIATLNVMREKVSLEQSILAHDKLENNADLDRSLAAPLNNTTQQ